MNKLSKLSFSRKLFWGKLLRLPITQNGLESNTKLYSPACTFECSVYISKYANMFISFTVLVRRKLWLFECLNGMFLSSQTFKYLMALFGRLWENSFVGEIVTRGRLWDFKPCSISGLFSPHSLLSLPLLSAYGLRCDVSLCFLFAMSVCCYISLPWQWWTLEL